MKILAIDPGNEETAYVLFDGKMIWDKNKVTNNDMVEKLQDYLLEEADTILIETISSYGMPVGQSCFDTCAFIGIYASMVKRYGKTLKLVFRGTVKMHHCKSTTAKDGNVNAVLQQKYGTDNTQKIPNLVYVNDEVKKRNGSLYMNGDIWAAFALATYWTEPTDNLVQNPLEREDNKLSKSLLKYIERNF